MNFIIIVRLIAIIILSNSIIFCESNITKDSNLKIGLLEYEPGDWNSDQTALSELLKFINKNTNIPVITVDRDIELKMKIGSDAFFKTKYIYMTGHGEMRGNGVWQGLNLKKDEIKNLRKHLIAGGFLHIDDNYNFDKTFFKEMKKVFPEKEWMVLPKNHKIFNVYYKFKGLPKIHKHDNKEPQALALFHNNKIIALYTLECDLGDGWENQEVHNDPEEIRLKALKMGANIVEYVFNEPLD